MSDEITDNIAQAVAKKHWAVFAIGGSDNSLPFSYTGGLTDMGIPELILIGPLPPNTSGLLLNTAARYLQKHSSPQWLMDGTTIISTGDSGLSCPIALVPAAHDVRTDMMLATTRHYGEDDYNVLQVVWPDEHHNFPWDKSSYNQFKKDGKFEGMQPLRQLHKRIFH